MRYLTFAGLLVLWLLAVTPFEARSAETKGIPDMLEPWKEWVLYETKDQFCPTPYNNGNEFMCAWPSRLLLDLNSKGGSFSQQWMIYNEGFVPLPGNSNTWPENVKLDGKEVPVLNRGSTPHLFLKTGRHSVTGSFKWNTVPEMIAVPEKSGLVTLRMDNEPVENPMMDRAGHLWLRNREGVKAEEDRHEIRFFRLVEDSIPMMVDNLLRIFVSGQSREIRLENILLKDFIPVKIESPLPVFIDNNKGIIIQARPGQWDIHITARSQGPVERLEPPENTSEREIWCFDSQNHLRMVKIEGVSPIDPGQTELPAGWKSYPSYLVGPEDEMLFREVRRGDPDPSPDQLTLHRTWWLDFDGKGYTIKDNISGTMSRQWYLAVNPPTMLGRVSVDGEDQLITGHGKDLKPGVELRRGSLNLVGEARLERTGSTLPAVGWDHDVQSLSGILNVPPGWRLFAAGGIDSIKGTWLQNWWNLLDLFIVLVICVAALKLWNIRTGLLALVTLVLIYHEPGAPKVVWLHILAATAMLRFIPEGWFRNIIKLWRVLAVVVLMVISVSFMVRQARVGIYPQLERVHSEISYGEPSFALISEKAEMQAKDMEEMDKDRKAPKALARRADSVFVSSFSLNESQLQGAYKNMIQKDPDAVIQTGPGLPGWNWRSYDIKWNGPVDSAHKMSLWFLSPFANLVLALVRIILLAFLILCMADMRRFKLTGLKNSAAAILLCLCLFPAAVRAADSSGEYPPREILDELQRRLLERPECLPFCADSPAMNIDISEDTMRILFRIHAAAETAVPLPGSPDIWRPETVILDSSTANIIQRDSKNILWILVPEGLHDVVLNGKAPLVNEFQVSLPLVSHSVNVKSTGWTIQGVDKEGRVENSIRLTRIREKDSQDKTEFAGTDITPFYHVERTLALGLEWRIRTNISRITRADRPVVVSVPLLEGEAVVTGGIRVENGEAVIQMAEGVNRIEWTSTLEQKDIVKLKAPESVPWTETWILDASPIWHCELSGIPLVHHQDMTGQWRPEWKPWPGEEVYVKITRPVPVSGRSLTIDNVNLVYTPGIRINSSSLEMTIRSSKGGQHKITLPEGADLQQVRISGKSQPISMQDSTVTVPVIPGAQNINIEWQEETESGIHTVTPAVDTGAEAVNADVTFEMPANRWILFAKGPRLGPAVLFWTYLFVIVLAGAVLGRVNITPLGSASWILLGLGLTQTSPLMAIVIAGWFLVMGVRKKSFLEKIPLSFNLAQILLALWFVAAMTGLWNSIETGLLGIPDMQIQGNGSSGYILHWTQDRISSALPECQVLSLNIYVFRCLMLLWALWLAYSLILKWIPWAWGCFNEGGVWKKMRGYRKGN